MFTPIRISSLFRGQALVRNPTEVCSRRNLRERNMWHRIRLPGPALASATEQYQLLQTLSDFLMGELLKVQRQIVEIRNAGLRAQLLQTPIEIYSRHEPDDSIALYLNDGALRLYQETTGTRAIEATMAERPPQTPEEEDDVLRGEALLLRHTWLSIRMQGR